MSLKSSKFLDNSKKPIVISRKPLTWLEHAEKHFKQASIYIKSSDDYGDYYGYYGDYVIVDYHEEQLMYLCLFSNVGMFD